jgi:hypothetical protein
MAGGAQLRRQHGRHFGAHPPPSARIMAGGWRSDSESVLEALRHTPAALQTDRAREFHDVFGYVPANGDGVGGWQQLAARWRRARGRQAAARWKRTRTASSTGGSNGKAAVGILCELNGWRSRAVGSAGGNGSVQANKSKPGSSHSLTVDKHYLRRGAKRIAESGGGRRSVN